jgi:hypothetical protein
VCVDKTAPPSVADIYTQAEWDLMVHEMNEIMYSTHCPMFPCAFFCCLPFACALSCCQSRRKEQLAAFIARQNLRMNPMGLEWIHTPLRMQHFQTDRMLAALRWNTQTRPAWEANNPQRRAVSREVVPTCFQSMEMAEAQKGGMTPNEQAMAQQMAAMQQQMSQMQMQQHAPGQQPQQIQMQPMGQLMVQSVDYPAAPQQQQMGQHRAQQQHQPHHSPIYSPSSPAS